VCAVARVRCELTHTHTHFLSLGTQNCRLEKSFLIDVVSKIYVATDSSPVDMQTYELCSDMIDVVIDVSCIYGMKEDSDGLAYDDKSQSLIKLSNGMVLYLREVNKCVQLPSPPTKLTRHTTSPTHATHNAQVPCPGVPPAEGELRQARYATGELRLARWW